MEDQPVNQELLAATVDQINGELRVVEQRLNAEHGIFNSRLTEWQNRQDVNIARVEQAQAAARAVDDEYRATITAQLMSQQANMSNMQEEIEKIKTLMKDMNTQIQAIESSQYHDPSSAMPSSTAPTVTPGEATSSKDAQDKMMDEMAQMKNKIIELIELKA